MTTVLIEKRNHPTVRKLREIRDGEDKSLLFCEGLKLVGELFDSGATVTEVFADKAMLGKLTKSPVQITLLKSDVMSFVSDLDTPPGVIAIAKRPRYQSQIGKQKAPYILILHRLQLPQNVGALLRTAEAAGVDEVWTTEKSADPFSPKSLRGSSASAFRIPIRTGVNLTQVIEELKKQGVKVYAATQQARTIYSDVDWRGGSALVMGSEGAGFAKEELSLFDEQIQIPMKGRVESLNVAAAAAVCLFEGARQRATKETR